MAYFLILCFGFLASFTEAGYFSWRPILIAAIAIVIFGLRELRVRGEILDGMS